MDNLEKENRPYRLAIVAAQGEPAGLEGGGDLQLQWLDDRLVRRPVDQTDCKGMDAMDPGPAAAEKQPGALLGTRHEGLLSPVEHKHTHSCFLTELVSGTCVPLSATMLQTGTNLTRFSSVSRVVCDQASRVQNWRSILEWVLDLPAT